MSEEYVHVEQPQSSPPDGEDFGAYPAAATIDQLEGNGITKGDIAKLKASNFCTVAGVAHATQRQLTGVRGISENKAAKLQEAAYQLVDMGFTTGIEMYQKEESLISITTGCKSMDNLLRGGIDTGSLTELYGEFRTGKSQLCHQLAVTCQLPVDMGGGEGRAMWIDCEGTYRSARIEAVANRYHLDPAATMANIAVARCYNHEQLAKLLDEARSMMSKTRFAILIIDSIMALLRSDFCGRGELSERQQRLGQILRKIRQMADEFGVAVVYTNQVVAQVDGMSMGFDPKKPIGGNVLAHASTTRLMLKKYKGPLRTCRVVDSPCIPEDDCHFGIYADGIDDPREDQEVDDN